MMIIILSFPFSSYTQLFALIHSSLAQKSFNPSLLFSLSKPHPPFLAELIFRAVTLRTRTIMADSSASYIHLVHHLIEKCLIYRMNKEECMEALSKHAKIEPVVTSTVWNELEKENKEFFEAYAAQSSQGGGGGTGDGGGGGTKDRMSEEETSEMIRKMISDQPDPSSASDEINQKKN